jgi:7,8-dihydropterin-6-yl-methyl-4-(beta-D-ribofuranosyl)aminobenzene 5'-phosphate synthase
MPGNVVGITILVDNHAGEGLEAEHGLSLWIEASGFRCLFDTGQNECLEHNARALGIRLSDADALVLSHGHYDHTGGLPFALKPAVNATVYCHPAVVLPRYRIQEGKTKTVTMPRASLAALDVVPSGKLRWVSSPLEISPSVYLTGMIPHINTIVGQDWPFYLDSNGDRPDPIQDDMAMWLDTPKGLVLILGCCHAGLPNTLEHVRKLSAGKRIHSIVGGLHLMDSGEEEIQSVISILREHSVELLVPLHCTGERARVLLKEAFGDAVRTGHAGMNFRI